MREFSGLGLRGPIRRAPPSTSDIVPEGTRFIEGTFSNAAGSRTYKLFIPSRSQGQPLPLVVMLHGCTQSPDDFAAGTRMNFLAEEQNCFVVYPEQPERSQPGEVLELVSHGRPAAGRGRTLADRRHHPPDHAGPCDRSEARLRREACRPAGPPPPSWARRIADLYAAVGIHSGLACGAASDLPSAFVAMRQGSGSEAIAEAGSPVPTIVFHGDRDTTVHPEQRRPNSRAVRQSDESDNEGASRTGAQRPCLYPHHPYRRGRAGDLRALEHSRCRPRVVGRQSRRLLHRSARAGRDEGNAALLPRAFASGPWATHGQLSAISLSPHGLRR